MQFFTSICLVSVGFASWTFVSGDSITASGNIVAQDVDDSSHYIYFDNSRSDGGVSGFKYCSGGFLNDDSSIILAGTCSAYLKINLDNCINKFSNNDSLQIKVELKYKSANEYNIFNSNNLITYDITMGNNINIIVDSETQNNSYMLIFTLENYLNTSAEPETIDDLIVNIHFNLTEEQFDKAYPYLSSMSFEYIIGIEGVNYDE